MPDSCTSFTSCLPPNPLDTAGVPAANTFESVINVIIFAVNLVLYVLWGFFIIITLFYISKSIYGLIFGEDEKTFENVRNTILKVVLASVGMIILVNVRWIFHIVYQLLGIPNVDNIFVILPWL